MVDAKNQKREIYPSGISREEKVFWSKGGHAEKLRKKEQFVSMNLSIFLKYFNINDTTGIFLCPNGEKWHNFTHFYLF